MAEDRIDSIVDRAAVITEIEATKTEVQQLIALIQSVKGTAINISGAKSASEFNKLNTELQKNIQLTNQAATATVNQSKASAVAAKAAANEAKLTKDLNNEYKQLSLAYNEASLRAKNYSLTLGANNPITKQATAEALALGAQLKTLDASTGTFNRNVGNYGGKLAEYGKKAFGFVRTAANILPGLGLSGAFLLIFTGISKVISAVSGGAKALNEFKESQKSLNKAFEDSNYKEAVKDVKELTTYIALAKNGFADKSDVLAEYNKRLGDTIGKANTLDEAEQLLVKNGDAYIKITLLKAAANIALSEAAQLAVDIAKEQSKRNQNLAPLEDEQKFRKIIENQTEYQRLNQLVNEGYYKSTVAGNEASRALNKYYNEQLEFLAGGTKAKNKKTLESIAADFQKNAALLGNKFGIDLFGNKNDKEKGSKSDKEKKGRDLAEADRKAAFEIEKQRLQASIDINNKIAADNERHINERTGAAFRAFIAETDLIDLTAEYEKNAKGLTKKEIQVISERANIDLLKAELRYYESLAKAQKDFNKVYYDEDEKLRKDLEKGIDDYYKKWKDNQDKIAADKKKKAEEEKRAEEELAKTKFDLQKQLATELQNLTFSILDANITRQKNAIQEQMDNLDKQKEKDIEVANQTIVNTQDKANAIAVIEARANAAKEALQRRQKELDVKKAQFDKAQAIARIIQETAVAIISNLKNPVLLPLIIAISAAQLAAVIATPIPKYKEGTQGHRGGLAIVGDGGRAEGITLPDGTVLKSPSTSTLMDLPAGSKVHPDFNKMMLTATMTKPPVFLANAVTDSSAKVVSGLKAVEKAIGKIPQTSIQVINPLRQRIRYGHSINEHLTRNLGK